MMKLANRMQFGIPEESSLGQLAFSHLHNVVYVIYRIVSAFLTLEEYQVMAWGKVMACSDRQEVASCVCQLDKANLLLKWPRSMLPLFFTDYGILHPFVLFLIYSIIL